MRLLTSLLLALGLTILVPKRSEGQIEIIGSILKGVIMAIDLNVQRAQTKTVLLQEIQKELENQLEGTQLGEIADWGRQLRDLYGDYYQELRVVKSAISSYQQARGIIDREARVIGDGQRAMQQLRQDPHFSAAELTHFAAVYNGLIDRAEQNIASLALVVQSLVTQMADGDRLQEIDAIGAAVDRDDASLHLFTQENILLSLQRTKEQAEIDFIKQLYGIQ